jgi:hypothetical protein
MRAKRIQNIKKPRLILIALLLTSLLAACSAVSVLVSENNLIVGVVAYKATSELIERADDKAARAERIIKYTEIASSLVDSSQPVSINTLADTLIDSINWDLIPPQDHALINSLISDLRHRLAREIQEYVILSAADEVSIEYIIDRMREAALYYV